MALGLLSAISANYVNGVQAMVIVDPIESYENSVSMKTYLFYEDKIELYGYVIIKNKNSEYDQEYIEGWKSYFNGRLFENMTSTPGLLIFLDNQLIDVFFKTSKLSQPDYLPIEIGESPFALLKENHY